MPAYDFRCSKCAKTFEVIRPMSAVGDETCPECGSKATKVFSPVGVAFKGSGFHNTDYRQPRKEDQGPASDAPSCPAKAEGAAPCPGCTAAN